MESITPPNFKNYLDVDRTSDKTNPIRVTLIFLRLRGLGVEFVIFVHSFISLRYLRGKLSGVLQIIIEVILTVYKNFYKENIARTQTFVE